MELPKKTIEFPANIGDKLYYIKNSKIKEYTIINIVPNIFSLKYDPTYFNFVVDVKGRGYLNSAEYKTISEFEIKEGKYFFDKKELVKQLIDQI